ncbi:MAG TPA: hypothetical protein VM616_06515 [Gammaproteobacteria bacterium]|nr:hypothetical protein [Gammaproteobacteria bacterium]
MSRIIAEFDRRQPLLARLGLAHLLLFVVLTLIMPFDGRTITGVDIWLKPAKFALSIGTYLLTMAWFLGELRLHRAIVLATAVAIALAMTTEQMLITLQAARETTSHYNFATPFDAAVFRTMGWGVALNSLAVTATLVLFLLHRDAPDRLAYLWGIRLGLALFLLGSLEGMLMIARGAHTVGLADGGPGIVLLNWSTRAGDLRVAHFLGIHALQALPIAGWLIDVGWRCRSAAVFKRSAIACVTTAYAALTYTAFAAAIRGSPGAFG